MNNAFLIPIGKVAQAYGWPPCAPVSIRTGLGFVAVLLASCSDGNANRLTASAEEAQVSSGSATQEKPPSADVPTKNPEVSKTMPSSQPQSTFPDCATLQSLSPDAAADVFEKQYPSKLVDPATVDSVTLTASEIEAIALFAACAAARTGYEPFVADNASALFASTRHGNAAFAALKRLSRAPGIEGKAAKAFDDQMRDYIKDPTG